MLQQKTKNLHRNKLWQTTGREAMEIQLVFLGFQSPTYNPRTPLLEFLDMNADFQLWTGKVYAVRSGKLLNVKMSFY